MRLKHHDTFNSISFKHLGIQIFVSTKIGSINRIIIFFSYIWLETSSESISNGAKADLSVFLVTILFMGRWGWTGTWGISCKLACWQRTLPSCNTRSQVEQFDWYRKHFITWQTESGWMSFKNIWYGGYWAFWMKWWLFWIGMKGCCWAGWFIITFPLGYGHFRWKGSGVELTEATGVGIPEVPCGANLKWPIILSDNWNISLISWRLIGILVEILKSPAFYPFQLEINRLLWSFLWSVLFNDS